MSSPTADVSVRLAWPADADAIARCQVDAWRESYADLVPAELLDGLDPSEFAAAWSEALTTPKDARSRVLVALERASVRGFSLVHPSQDPDADPVVDGEIAEFIVGPAYRRAGHGSRLLQASIDTMRADKLTRAFWWIGATDDALRGFVADTGWEPDGAHRELESEVGSTLKQVRLHSDLTEN